MTDSGAHDLAWRKASYSVGNGECVEVAPVGGTVLVRDSKNASGAVLGCPAGAWRAFLARIKNDSTGKMR